MQDVTFQKIREVVYNRSGISLGENKQALVRARIAKRIRVLNLGSYEEYLEYMLDDSSGVELENMLDVISTNTTNFYREDAHFDIMRQILKQWIEGGLRKLRVWCAAASTGEEPYTLAIELLETIGDKRVDARILATDIAPSVLKTALRGEYTEDKVEPVPKRLRHLYFERKRNGNGYIYTAGQVLKDLILFRQLNLSVTPFPLKNQVDIIFCRNVMIYFDRQVRARLVDEFKRLIRPGGYLFVGHAESITAYSKGFKCLKPSVYIRE